MRENIELAWWENRFFLNDNFAENKITEKLRYEHKRRFLKKLRDFLGDTIDDFSPEMPTTTEYINQYFKLKMFIMLNGRVLVKLCDWTR